MRVSIVTYPEHIAVPRIAEFAGIAIYMYWSDHTPPHFHAIQGEHEAAISIAARRVIAGRLPRRTLAIVLAWAKFQERELTANWRRAEMGESLLRIPALDELP
jgi:hypothetical protein